VSCESPATVGQAVGQVSPLAHPERPPRTQPLATKRRTHAAQRERPGGEARAFTLNRSARRFRAPLEGGRAKEVSNRRVGFRLPQGARYPFSVSETGFRIAWRDGDTRETGPAVDLLVPLPPVRGVSVAVGHGRASTRALALRHRPAFVASIADRSTCVNIAGSSIHGMWPAFRMVSRRASGRMATIRGQKVGPRSQ